MALQAAADIFGRAILTPSGTPSNWQKSADGGATWVDISTDQLVDNGDGTWTDHRPTKNYRKTTNASGTLTFIEYAVFCRTWTNQATYSPIKPSSITIDGVAKKIPPNPARWQDQSGTKLYSPQMYFGENGLALQAHTYSVVGATDLNFYYSDFSVNYGTTIRYKCTVNSQDETADIAPRPDRASVIQTYSTQAKTLLSTYTGSSDYDSHFTGGGNYAFGSALFMCVMWYHTTGDPAWLPIIQTAYDDDVAVPKSNTDGSMELWQMCRLTYYLHSAYTFLKTTPGFATSAYTALADNMLNLAASFVNLARTDWQRMVGVRNTNLLSISKNSQNTTNAFNHYAGCAFALALIHQEPDVQNTSYPNEYQNATLNNLVDALTDRAFYDDRWYTRTSNAHNDMNPFLIPYVWGYNFESYSGAVNYNGWARKWVKHNAGGGLAVYECVGDPPTGTAPNSTTDDNCKWPLVYAGSLPAASAHPSGTVVFNWTDLKAYKTNGSTWTEHYWIRHPEEYGAGIYNHLGVQEIDEENGIWDFEYDQYGASDESYADYMWPFINYLVGKGYGTVDYSGELSAHNDWILRHGLKEPYWMHILFFSNITDPPSIAVRLHAYWNQTSLTEGDTTFDNFADYLYSNALWASGGCQSIAGTDNWQVSAYDPTGFKSLPAMNRIFPYNAYSSYGFTFNGAGISVGEWAAFAYQPVTENNKIAGMYKDLDQENITLTVASGSQAHRIEYQWDGTDSPQIYSAPFAMQPGTLYWRGVYDDGTNVGYETWRTAAYDYEGSIRLHGTKKPIIKLRGGLNAVLKVKGQGA